jgi:general secretion pathway protein I
MKWHGCKNMKSRSGLSLLEVMLALTILAMTVALLSQITKQATDNGLMAQRLATAQMLCDSKMAEVLAGAIPLTTGPWTEITDSMQRGTWYYQIQTTTTERPNMVGVRLSITDQPNAVENPELFHVVRWMIDPNLGLDTIPESTDATGATGSTNPTGGSAGGIQ